MYKSICASAFGLAIALILVNSSNATTINVDGGNYSGIAAAPDTGTTWNNVALWPL